jgi:prepilin-type N-terminal cleavage/methylation domain-containing protein
MKRDLRGFSLIELLIVVAIILIIAAIAIPNLLRSRIAMTRPGAAGARLPVPLLPAPRCARFVSSRTSAPDTWPKSAPGPASSSPPEKLPLRRLLTLGPDPCAPARAPIRTHRCDPAALAIRARPTQTG